MNNVFVRFSMKLAAKHFKLMSRAKVTPSGAETQQW